MTVVELRLHRSLFEVWARRPVPVVLGELGPLIGAEGEVPVLAADEVVRGWGAVVVDGRAVDLGVHALPQVGAVVDPGFDDDPPADEEAWRDRLADVGAGPDGARRLQLAFTQLVHHAVVGRTPRPLPVSARAPDDLLALRVAPGYLAAVLERCPDAADRMTSARENLAADLGVRVPGVSIEEADLPDGVFGFRVGDLPLPLYRGLAADEIGFLPPSTSGPSALATGSWRYPTMTVLHRGPAASRELVTLAGELVWDAGSALASALDIEVRRHAEALVDEESVLELLRMQAGPGLLEAVDALVGPGRLVGAVRTLLAQRIPVADLVAVAERLVDAALAATPDAELTAFLRAGASWGMAAAAGRGQRIVDGYVLDPRWPTGPPDEAAARLRAALRRNRDLHGISPAPMLLVAPGAAVPAVTALRPGFDDLLVVGADELPAAVVVHPLAGIPLDAADDVAG